jgi:hypothetical protein
VRSSGSHVFGGAELNLEFAGELADDFPNDVASFSRSDSGSAI